MVMSSKSIGDKKKAHTHKSMSLPGFKPATVRIVPSYRVTEPPEYAGSSLRTMSLAILVSAASPTIIWTQYEA